MVKRASRKPKDRPTKKERRIVLVATEGKNKTEKTYLAEFNRLQKSYRIVFAEGNYTDPINIVSSAVSSVDKKELDLDADDAAYAIFDIDFGKESQIKEARRIAENNNVGLLLSNPCFEIWLLLHFRYSTRGYTSNEAVIDELRNRWPDYRKNIKSFEYIVDRIDIAIENSKKLIDYQDSVNPLTEIENRNPATNIHELIEMLIIGGDDNNTKE